MRNKQAQLYQVTTDLRQYTVIELYIENLSAFFSQIVKNVLKVTTTGRDTSPKINDVDIFINQQGQVCYVVLFFSKTNEIDLGAYLQKLKRKYKISHLSYDQLQLLSTQGSKQPTVCQIPGLLSIRLVDTTALALWMLSEGTDGQEIDTE